MKSIGIVLSGCGVKDRSEFHGVKNGQGDFTIEGEHFTVNQDVQAMIQMNHTVEKLIRFISIASASIAKVQGSSYPKLGIDNDYSAVQILEEVSAEHFNCKVEEITFDTEHHIVFTPTYRLKLSTSKIAMDLEKLINKNIEDK